jgi:hypothetical protein
MHSTVTGPGWATAVVEVKDSICPTVSAAVSDRRSTTDDQPVLIGGYYDLLKPVHQGISARVAVRLHLDGRIGA